MAPRLSALRSCYGPPDATSPFSIFKPGKPQQNSYVERYNRTVRTEWLAPSIFETIKEAQDHATEWLWTYKNLSRRLKTNDCRAADRPNMAIGGITPAMKLKNAA